MDKFVCAAIEYTDHEGIPVHSDLCPPDHDPNLMWDDDWLQRLHAALDEWVHRSGGTGHFVIGGANLWDALNAWGE